MSGWGWVGAGQAVRDAGNAFQRYQGERRRNLEEDRDFGLRAQAIQDETAHRAAMLALQRDELGLSREAGQRAQEQLDLQKQAGELARQGVVRDRFKEMNAGDAVPQSLADQATELGIADQVFQRLPGARNMAPGAIPEIEGIGPEFLIGENYAREMRPQAEIAEEARRSSAALRDAEQHTSQLKTAEALRAESAARAGMYGRSQQDEDRRVRNNAMITVLPQARLREAADMARVQKLEQELNSNFLLRTDPVQLKALETALATARTQAATSRAQVDKIMQGLSSAELNPQMDPDFLGELQKLQLEGISFNGTPAPAPGAVTDPTQLLPAQRNPFSRR